MYKQSLKLQALSCFRMLITGCNKGVKIHSWLAQDVIKHVKRSSSCISLRKGWRWGWKAAGWKEQAFFHTDQQRQGIGCYSVNRPGIPWLFSCYAMGGLGKRKKKKKKEVLHICFCYCAPEDSLRHLAKRKNRSYLYLTLPEGNTSFSFHFTFLKEFIFLFKCGPCQEGKGCLTWLPDGGPFQKTSSLLRTEGRGMH